MNKQKLILIGGGGHCKSCIDVIEQEGKYEILGILDQPEKKGDKILGYEVIGDDGDYEKFRQQGCDFLITVGQIKTAGIRKRIYENLKNIDAGIATVISPKAYVSQHAFIEKGTIVMHHAFVNAGARIGKNCILNSGCGIEHDAFIGNHCHISTFAVVNGDCNIGDEVFIGSNTTIYSQLSVAGKVVIGAGAVVHKDINSSGTWIGNPARKIR